MITYAQQQKSEPEDEDRRKIFEEELDLCRADLIQEKDFRKIKEFFREFEVLKAEQMDYALRCEYLDYLTNRKKLRRATRYLSSYDKTVQAYIQYQVKEQPWISKRIWTIKKQILYIPYHPNVEIAKRVSEYDNKEKLVWDFGRTCSELLKEQMFLVLNEILETVFDRAYLQEKLILLRLFYDYCTQEEIQDIEQINQIQINRFFMILSGRFGRSRLGRRGMIIDECRRILFQKNENIHWNANVWYVESLHMARHRINPAAPTMRISFLDIENEDWRNLAKEYLRYQIGISDCSITTIMWRYRDIRNLILWICEKNLSLAECKAENFQEYFGEVEKKELSEKRFNDIVHSIYGFFSLMVMHGHIKRIPFVVSYYQKKLIRIHHDRSLMIEQYQEAITLLPKMEETLRCMYLHFWCLGLRISEVCALKGNAYEWKNGAAWIRLYQQKTKNYKRIPIPDGLYKVMQIYIKRHEIKPDDYLFQNTCGRIYQAAACRDNLKIFFRQNPIGDGSYHFQSHDYRHMIATQLYDEGVSLQTIREYLGHYYLEMTEQYIDYIPKKIAEENEKYFTKKGNSLATSLREEMRKKNETILCRSEKNGWR